LAHRLHVVYKYRANQVNLSLRRFVSRPLNFGFDSWLIVILHCSKSGYNRGRRSKILGQLN